MYNTNIVTGMPKKNNPNITKKAGAEAPTLNFGKIMFLRNLVYRIKQFDQLR